MPKVDLTPRLAHESKPGGKDTILFDKSLPGFGLRIHPSGRKVWVVQARIEGRIRRIVNARHGEKELAEARRRARDMRGRELHRRHQAGEGGPDLLGVRRGILAALRSVLKPLRARNRAHRSQGPHPARLRPDAA